MRLRRSELAAVLLLTLVAAVCGYVGSYLALVRPGAHIGIAPQLGYHDDDYALIGESGSQLFWTVHLVDRHFRPRYWEGSPPWYGDPVSCCPPGYEFKLSPEAAAEKAKGVEQAEEVCKGSE